MTTEFIQEKVDYLIKCAWNASQESLTATSTRKWGNRMDKAREDVIKEYNTLLDNSIPIKSITNDS